LLWKKVLIHTKALKINTGKWLKSVPEPMGNENICTHFYLFSKVYKVASTDNSNKFWAFKKITYSKDNEGVKVKSSCYSG